LRPPRPPPTARPRPTRQAGWRGRRRHRALRTRHGREMSSSGCGQGTTSPPPGPAQRNLPPTAAEWSQSAPAPAPPGALDHSAAPIDRGSYGCATDRAVFRGKGPLSARLLPGSSKRYAESGKLHRKGFKTRPAHLLTGSSSQSDRASQELAPPAALGAYILTTAKDPPATPLHLPVQ
jgi:hypothetical protein